LGSRPELPGVQFEQAQLPPGSSRCKEEPKIEASFLSLKVSVHP
jgi:hypothetical protein